MKIAVYNRYWHVLGGGEKYAGSIAQHLGRFGAVDLVSHSSFSVNALEKRFGLDLSSCRKLILPGYAERHAEELSREYDLWINSSYHSSLPSHARCSLLFVFFPISGPLLARLIRQVHPSLAPLWLNEWTWRNNHFWESYQRVVAISRYSAEWISRWWHTDSSILYPPVDLICAGNEMKTNTILTVGRFFLGGHSKRQDFMIRTFRKMCDCHNITGWEFHLCGGRHNEPWNKLYMRQLRSMAQGYPIHIHEDLAKENLDALYRSASIYWHASGYGVKEERTPDKVEHFGISTVEAMSARCIPIVFDGGGQREIVDHDWNGYRWKRANDLSLFTLQAMEQQESDQMRECAVLKAHEYSQCSFTNQLGHILKLCGI